MAIPQYINKSAFASGTNNITVGTVANAQADDLILLFVESANQAISTPSGYAQVTDSPQSTGSAAAAGGVRLACFYRFATGADTTTLITDTGDHTTAIKILIRGVDTTTPFNATAGSVQSTAATSWTLPSVTTTADNCLIIYGLGLDRDASSTTNVSGFTNSNLSNILELHDQVVTSGVGGGLAVYEGEKATAGSVGTSTITSAASTTAAFLTIALNEALLPEITGSLSVTETGNDSFSASGEVLVSGALSVSETGNDTFSASGSVTDPANTGTLAATETGTDTFSSTGDVIVQGALSVSETGNDTFSASGDVIVKGSLSVTETGTDSFSATGSALLVSTGSLDATEANDTLSASGTVLIEGVVDASETGSDTFTAIGVATDARSGSMSATEASDFLGSYVVDNYVESGYSQSGWEGFVYYEVPLPSTVQAGVRYGPNGSLVGTFAGGGAGTTYIDINTGKIIRILTSSAAITL